MSDIYNVLSKHFVGETTPDEEFLVEQFKLENPKEYQTLKSFWTKKDLNLLEFNTAKAWGKVQKSKPAKRIFLYPYLRKVATIAAVFLIATAGIYFYNNQIAPPEIASFTATVQNEKIALEDGSVIYLNNNARISFPIKFSSNKREVTLEGEAFFEIAKDANRPFIIHTNHSDVEVLGTSFNINTQVVQTEIAVATGKVKVSSLSINESAILTPNQSALVKHSFMEVYTTKNINYLAWKTGVFKFKQAPISQVVADLNSYYGDKFVLAKTNSDCVLSATINQNELQEVVEIIQLSCDLKLKLKNDHYELH